MTTEHTFLVTLAMDDDFDGDPEVAQRFLRDLVDDGLGPIQRLVEVNLPSDDDRLRIHAERSASFERSRAMQAEREQREVATEIFGDIIITDRDWYREINAWIGVSADEHVAASLTEEGAVDRTMEALRDFLERRMRDWYDRHQFGSRIEAEAVAAMMDNIDWEDVADHYREEVEEVIETTWQEQLDEDDDEDDY